LPPPLSVRGERGPVPHRYRLYEPRPGPPLRAVVGPFHGARAVLGLRLPQPSVRAELRTQGRPLMIHELRTYTVTQGSLPWR